MSTQSDWKIAGFGFAGPADNPNSQSTLPPISLSEVLYHEPRLPRSIQMDLDYTSPDFAMDSNVSACADMFSLGLLLLALYNSPHTSPIKSHSNLSTYKKLLSSSSTTPSSSNNFLCSRPLPNDLKSAVLPRLITRRPAQRMNAREFQQSQFFDNILVSSIRFLDALPAKTPNEKSQFMKGLPKILEQFPKSVLDKKVLPALLEETKDRDLLFLILQNVFKIIKILPSSKRAMTDKILPQLRDIFSTNSGKPGQHERDTAKEAGLVVVLENMGLIGDNCNGKEFKECKRSWVATKNSHTDRAPDMLPILHIGLESPTHAIVDKSLGCLPTILAILDFSTIKHELFPTVASVFSKTSSLGIKVRGLEAFVILCGGSSDSDYDATDGLDGAIITSRPSKPSNSAVLDKYTVQEKIVPLLKAMKTKEPAVMMAALAVFKQVGRLADAEFLAMEALPILWSFSLGPLLNLQQFQQFMDLIKKLSARIEAEQVKKLRDLSSSNGNHSQDTARSNDLMNVGSISSFANGGEDVGENDFERLVLGKRVTNGNDMLGEDLVQPQRVRQPIAQPPVFSWSSPAPGLGQMGQVPTPGLHPQSRTITPDHSLNAFAALSPTSSAGVPSNMQRTTANGLNSFAPMQPAKPSPRSSMGVPPPFQQAQSGFTMPPPSQAQNTTLFSTFSIAPPPSSPPPRSGMQGQHEGSFNSMMPKYGPTSGNFTPHPKLNAEQGKKSGLDAFESLL